MTEPLKILLLEDSDEDAALLSRFLKRNKVSGDIVRVWTKHEFLAALQPGVFDLIIADHTLPAYNGMEAYRSVRQMGLDIPFILITGAVSEKLLTDYAREGIDDYILKDNLLRLPVSIQNVINKKKLETLYKQLHAVYNDIKDSINYAKLIQDAILPDLRTLRSSFRKSFVFYNPKDVLSGDFYWFEEVDSNVIFAVADCTGHGVPGALLSVLGTNLLNEAVGIKKLKDPAGILQWMSVQVQALLKHQTSSLRDGMDMALCTFDKENGVLSYAGANRPVIVERLGNLIELHPTRGSIGEKEGGTGFETRNLKTQSGDRIFLFSDGFADQFHFKTGKKLLAKRLKKLITLSAGLPIFAQRKIIVRYFERWKGTQEQVDDVLLMCVEIP
jgi:phosphoserine phosphatase RsbU/P